MLVLESIWRFSLHILSLKNSLEFSHWILSVLVISLITLSDSFLSSPQGTISLDGHDIRQLNPVWLRSKIGTVSQVRREGSISISLSFKITFVTGHGGLRL